MMLTQKPLQTHRGYWVEGIMENTLAALQEARRRGSEMVEFDVQITKDYVPVLYHDATLKRLHHVPIRVADLKYEQIKRFAPNITSLEEVLADLAVPDYLNIELKTEAIMDPALEIQVSQLLRKYKAQDRVVISSFNPFSLIRLRGFLPEVARALLVSEDEGPKNKEFLKKMKLLPLCEARYLHWDESMMTLEKMLPYLDKGYLFSAYTVNQKERAQELFTLGVKSVISDQILSL